MAGQAYVLRVWPIASEVNMAEETACSLVGVSVIEVFADLVRVTVVVGGQAVRPYNDTC